jgi:hypothetical protein
LLLQKKLLLLFLHFLILPNTSALQIEINSTKNIAITLSWLVKLPFAQAFVTAGAAATAAEESAVLAAATTIFTGAEETAAGAGAFSDDIATRTWEHDVRQLIIKNNSVLKRKGTRWMHQTCTSSAAITRAGMQRTSIGGGRLTGEGLAGGQ